MAEASGNGRTHRDDDMATKSVDGAGESVEVSKHPEPTISSSDLSLADIERRQSRPLHWAMFIVALLIALVAPYWVGRFLAVNHAAGITSRLATYSLQGMAFASWAVTVVMFACLAMVIIDTRRWIWRVLFVLTLAIEQFIAGVALLRFDYWYSTFVVYGDSAKIVNAADLGIIAAGIGVAVFAVLFVGLLVVIRKDSPLNVLTQGWALMIMYFGIELVALLVVQFGGLLTTIG